jgi:hypothetical protein
MATYITKRAKDLDLPMVDAKEPLQLEVTSRDITTAAQKNSKCCAFARACHRSKNVNAAYFFRSTAWLEFDDKLVRYTLPPSMQKEIVSFDRNRSMEPGLYQLSAPSKSSTLKAAMKRSKKRPGRHQPGEGKIKRKFVHRTTNARSTFEPGWVPVDATT